MPSKDPRHQWRRFIDLRGVSRLGFTCVRTRAETVIVDDAMNQQRCVVARCSGCGAEGVTLDLGVLRWRRLFLRATQFSTLPNRRPSVWSLPSQWDGTVEYISEK